MSDDNTPSPTMGAAAVDSTTTDTSLQDTSVGGMAARAAFLSLFIITGFVGNCVLIATIAQNSRLRTMTINRCILSLAIASLLDASVNMPLILGATITETWDYSETACKVNAFGIQLMSIVVCVGLMLLTLERFLAIMDPLRKHRRLTLVKISIVIGFVWVHGIAFSFPLLLDSIVPIQVFSARYLCTISNNAPLLYLCLTSIFAYLFPIFMTFGFFIYIINKGIKQNREDHKRRSVEGYTGSVVPPHKIWAEIEGAKYAGVLFVLWCILQGPYLVLSSIMWYKNSEELSDNEKVNDFLHFEYPWELELAFTWLKLSYPGFLPTVTLLWKKDVWKKIRNKLCKKKNLVVDSSAHSSPDHQSTTANGLSAVSNGVPVLYASENGLHVKTYGDEDTLSDDSKSETNNVKGGRSQKCDVMGSRDLVQLDEDTSDYDSSGDIDPFSMSNPISVRTEYGRQHSVRKSKDCLQESGSIKVKPSRNEIEETEVVEISEKEHRQKKKKRNNLSNGSKDSSLEADIDEAEMGEVNHGTVIEDIHAAEQHEVNLERTSHDSGMGSMENDRKLNRVRKKKNSDDKMEDDKPNTTDCWIADVQQVANPPSQITRKKRKKKSAVSNQDSITTNDAETTPKETLSENKLPLRLEPLQHSEQSLHDNFSKGPKLPSVHRPEIQPRKSKTDDGKTKGSADKPKKPIPEKRVRTRSEQSLREEQCECGQAAEAEYPNQRPATNQVTAEVHQLEIQETDLEQPRPLPKPKKRKKKKRIDESHKKTLAQELDEEMQGVLY